MKTKQIIAVTALFVLTVLSAVTVPAVFAVGPNPSVTRQDVEYTLRNSVDVVENKYLNYYSQLPSIQTFVNDDGGVTVCAADEVAHDTYIYEYSRAMKLLKTHKFHNELETLGAFTKDSAGNYYFFYTAAVAENEHDKENMAMVKYDASGKQQKVYKLKAFADNSFNGIRVPFASSTCRLELSGSMLAVYFARRMFKTEDGLNHQASYGFVLNKDTFERVDRPGTGGYNENSGGRMAMPYVSHSFNEFILPFESGFLFADHGDASPRCFTFAGFQQDGNTKRLHAFQFEGASGANATYAEMGGLAKTSSGFIFAGSYGEVQNKPRNLFILTFDDNLSACSEPIYLTSYTENTGHVAHPKITALDAGRYLLLWEKCTFLTASGPVNAATGYLSTYMLIIDEQGKPLSKEKELPGIRLNMNDTLRYNPQTKKVYWAVNDGSQAIRTFALDPAAAIAIKKEAPAKAITHRHSAGDMLLGFNWSFFGAMTNTNPLDIISTVGDTLDSLDFDVQGTAPNFTVDVTIDLPEYFATARVLNLGLSYEYYLFHWMSLGTGLGFGPEVNVVTKGGRTGISVSGAATEDAAKEAAISQALNVVHAQAGLFLTIPFNVHFNIPKVEWLYTGLGAELHIPVSDAGLDDLIGADIAKYFPGGSMKGKMFVSMPIDLGFDFSRGSRLFFRVEPEFFGDGMMSWPVSLVWQSKLWKLANAAIPGAR